MAADEKTTPLPDTPVEEVTLDRISELLVSEGINHEPEGEYLRTGFNNFAVTFALDEKEHTRSLVVEGLWRGEVPLADGASLLVTVSEWNQARFAPTMRFGEMNGQHLVVLAWRSIELSHGLSRNQLGGFTMSTLEAFDAAFSFIEQQFPQLVTWRYTP